MAASRRAVFGRASVPGGEIKARKRAKKAILGNGAPDDTVLVPADALNGFREADIVKSGLL